MLLAQYQSPRPGDLAAPLAAPADERTAFTVAVAEEPAVLVWTKPDSTWRDIIRSWVMPAVALADADNEASHAG